MAVGVHTTQFEIHDSKSGLYHPVLELAAEEAGRHARSGNVRPVMIAGIVGATDQAVREACLARDLGYDCGLLSLAALSNDSEAALIEHARIVAEIIPLFGFYLQPAVGGRVLSYAFWRRLAELDGLVAIKIAPFNRYQTIDVVRAVAEAGRAGDVALYTGNDDSIVVDLLTTFPFGNREGSDPSHPSDGSHASDGSHISGGLHTSGRLHTSGGSHTSVGLRSSGGLHISGGLLGHWAVWTKRAVELLDEIKAARRRESVPRELLTRSIEVTDANAAFFDPQHDFKGSIVGIHEVLRRQGLLSTRLTLNADVDLSPGQLEEIDRIYSAYPHLSDDDFVRAHLDEWLST